MHGKWIADTFGNFPSNGIQLLLNLMQHPACTWSIFKLRFHAFKCFGSVAVAANTLGAWRPLSEVPHLCSRGHQPSFTLHLLGLSDAVLQEEIYTAAGSLIDRRQQWALEKQAVKLVLLEEHRGPPVNCWSLINYNQNQLKMLLLTGSN